MGTMIQCAGFLQRPVVYKWQYALSLSLFNVSAGNPREGSPGVPRKGLITGENVSLLAAALRIQVCLTWPFEFGCLVSGC